MYLSKVESCQFKAYTWQSKQRTEVSDDNRSSAVVVGSVGGDDDGDDVQVALDMSVAIA